VRIGSSETRRLYSALLALAYAMPAVLLARAGGGWPVLLPWLTLPWAWGLVAELQRAESPAAFQGALVRTARLHAVYSALLAVGLAV
jgi:1,4-dihydroxy-2-naphthoate octaprenyltransferase